MNKGYILIYHRHKRLDLDKLGYRVPVELHLCAEFARRGGAVLVCAQ
jgi:hypothetical protein